MYTTTVRFDFEEKKGVRWQFEIFYIYTVGLLRASNINNSDLKVQKNFIQTLIPSNTYFDRDI